MYDFLPIFFGLFVFGSESVNKCVNIFVTGRLFNSKLDPRTQNPTPPLLVGCCFPKLPSESALFPNSSSRL